MGKRIERNLISMGCTLFSCLRCQGCVPSMGFDCNMCNILGICYGCNIYNCWLSHDRKNYYISLLEKEAYKNGSGERYLQEMKSAVESWNMWTPISACCCVVGCFEGCIAGG